MEWREPSRKIFHPNDVVPCRWHDVAGTKWMDFARSSNRDQSFPGFILDSIGNARRRHEPSFNSQFLSSKPCLIRFRLAFCTVCVGLGLILGRVVRLIPIRRNPRQETRPATKRANLRSARLMTSHITLPKSIRCCVGSSSAMTKLLLDRYPNGHVSCRVATENHHPLLGFVGGVTSPGDGHRENRVSLSRYPMAQAERYTSLARNSARAKSFGHVEAWESISRNSR